MLFKLHSILVILVVQFSLSGAVNAKEFSQVWKCKESFGGSDKVIVTARVDNSNESGEIDVSGITHQTLYQVQGFNRRWDFGSKAEYGFIIKPNGDSYYYEFDDGSGVDTKPSMLMKCSQ